MALAARTAQVLADLGIAVGHHATSEPVFLIGEDVDSSTHWLAGAS